MSGQLGRKTHHIRDQTSTCQWK